MKTILRNYAIYTLLLYFLPLLIPGLKVHGGIGELFIGGLALTILFIILRPIFNILSFPINMITLGIFSLFTNALIIYFLTVIVTGITISSFTYPRTDLVGVIIPKIHLTTFWAYIYTAFVLSFMESCIKWLVR